MADYGIVQEALDRGYTLDEIADKLSTTSGFDPAAIRERGYGAPDILAKLGYEQPATEQPEQSDTGDTMRGLGTAFKQVPQLGYGLIAAGGATLEKVTGEGGIATGIKQAGVKGFEEWGDKIAATSRESDSFTYSWEKAKEGDFGALVDWMQYGIGYAGGQAIQILGTAGVGALAAKGAGIGASKLAAGMVAKESARIAATKEGAALTADALAKAATANVASSIGRNTALAATAFGMEGGEIGGDLVASAEREGRQLTGAELGKAFGATIAAGGLEFVGDKIGLDLMLGKGVGKMAGVTGRVARGTAGAASGIATEGGTEYLQTGIEEYGKGAESAVLPFMQSEQAQRQAFDAAALGGLGGAVMGGTGGAMSRPEKAELSPEQITAEVTSQPTLDDAINATNELLNDPVGQFVAQSEAPQPARDIGATSNFNTGFGQVNELADFAAQERTDLEAQRAAMLAEQQDTNAVRLSSELETTDARVAGVAEAESRQSRLTALDSIYANPDERTPGMSFLAHLEANHPNNPIPTPEEKRIIAQREQAYQAFKSMPEETTDFGIPEPTAKPNVQRAPEAQIAKVDDFLARGYLPANGGRILQNDQGKKLILNNAQREYVKNLPKTEIQPTEQTDVGITTAPLDAGVDRATDAMSSADAAGSDADGVLRYEAATGAGRDAMPGTAVATDGADQSAPGGVRPDAVSQDGAPSGYTRIAGYERMDATTSTSKKPFSWQMPKAEFVAKKVAEGLSQDTAARGHENAVKLALKMKKDVPENVLADYPDIAKGAENAQGQTESQLAAPMRDAASQADAVAVGADVLPEVQQVGADSAQDGDGSAELVNPEAGIRKGIYSTQGAEPLFNTSGLPNRGRELIQSKAEEYAQKLRDAGANVLEVTHSGSAAGPSSYIKVAGQPDIRISGHSKGVFNTGGVINIGSDEAFSNLLDIIPVSPKLTQEQISDRIAKAKEEEIATMYPIRIKSAQKKLAKGKGLTISEQEAMDWLNSNQPQPAAESKQSAIASIKASELDAAAKLKAIEALNTGALAPEDVRDVVGKTETIEAKEADKGMALYEPSKGYGDQTDTPAFKRWFGGSVVTDNGKPMSEGGKPLVVYHETDADFSEFKIEDGKRSAEDGEMPTGAFFKPRPVGIGVAGDGEQQMPVYLSIKNPLVVADRPALVRRFSNEIQGYRELVEQESDINERWKADPRSDWAVTGERAVAAFNEAMREWNGEIAAVAAQQKRLVNKWFASSEHDGLIVERDSGSLGRSTKTFVAFRPEQIKSATGNRGAFDPANPSIVAEPTAQGYTDPYDTLEPRPNTEPEQLEAGRQALAAAERRIFGRDNSPLRGSAAILGSAIPADFREKGYTSLVGQKVESSHDLAMISQVLRDPRFETFRVFLVKDNKIVGERAYTSRLAASVSIPGDLHEQISADMGRTQADGYWLLHNHPAGFAKASSADMNLTEMLATNAKGMLGHVIIDHNEYNSITLKSGLYGPEARQDIIKANLGAMAVSPEVPHPTLGATITKPADFAAIARRLQKDGVYSSIIGTGGEAGAVTMVLDVPDMASRKGVDRLRAGAAIRRAARETHSGRLFAVVPGELSQYPHLMDAGLFTDIISQSTGQSAAELGMLSSQDHGTAAERRGLLAYVAEPTAPAYGEAPLASRAEGAKSGTAQTDTPEFKRWSEGAPVVEPDELYAYEGGPAVFRLYHGTTGDFTVFDKERANNESDLGGGFYFTNNQDDVSENYAGEGPDLTQKIQMRAEQIAGETDREYDDPEVIAEAKQALSVEHGGMTMKVFVKAQNPVLIGGGNETKLTYELVAQTDDYVDDARAEIEDEYVDEIESGDYSAKEIDELVAERAQEKARDDGMEEESGTLVDFIVALRDVASQYSDGEVEGAIDAVMQRAMDEGGIGASALIEEIKSAEEFGYYTDDNGTLVSNEIIREAFERAGFDAFVDYTVNDKFGSERRAGKSMAGMDESTVHVIAFRPEQIKSAIGNSGAFDPSNPDIRASRSARTTGQTVSSVKQATQALRNRWLGFRKIEIVQSDSDLPQEFREGVLRSGVDPTGSEGWFDPKTKTVYLVADNLASPERAVFVAAHEVAGHGGIRMLGKPVADALDFAGKNGFVQKLAKAIAADRGETFNAKMHTDEALAELAAATITDNVDAILNRYGVKVPAIMRQNLMGSIQRIIEAVRTFLAKVFGRDVDAVSDADVYGMLTAMREVVEGKAQGYDAAGGTDGVMASRAQQRDLQGLSEKEIRMVNAGFVKGFGNSPSQPADSAPEEGSGSSPLPAETKTEAARRVGQDAMLRFRVIQDWLKDQGVKLSEAADVYVRENLSKATTANRIEDFRNFEIEPLIQNIAKAGFEISDIVDYLQALHIQEANARMRKIHNDPKATANGITDAEAKKALVEFQAMPKFAEFKALADEVGRIGAQTLEMRYAEGLVSKEQYDAYKATYQHWIPLRGDMPKQQGFGRGMSTNAKQKRRFGHDQREEFIFENLVADRERAIFQIEHNKLGRAVANFILEANNPDIGTISKPERQSVLKDSSYAVAYNGQILSAFNTKQEAQNYILKTVSSKSGAIQGLALNAADFDIQKTSDPHVAMMVKPMLAENEIQVYINGHAVRMQLNDPLLARAATNAGIEQLAGIMYVARQINGFLSKAYTAWSPDFLFVNPVRDIYQGSVVLTGKEGIGFSGKAMKNYAWAWKELWAAHNDTRKSQWVTRYRNAGGNTGGAYLSDIERVGQETTAALQEFMGWKKTFDSVQAASLQAGDSPAKARTKAAMRAGMAGGKKLPILGHFARIMERLNGVFENTLRLATFKAAIEAGKTDQQAAVLAKDLMNFNRKGEIANQMGAAYIFFNPAMQGSHVVLQSLTTSPNSGQARWLIGGLMMTAFLLAEAARSGDDDDERDWRNIPDHVKARNLVLKFGDMQVTIPVAYGFGVFHSLGNAISDVLHGVDSEKASLNMATAMFENFSVFGNPLIEKDGKMEFRPEQLLPTVPKMVIAPSTNLDGLGRTIQPHKYKASSPDSQNMTRSVRGTLYADIAASLNDWTGGNEYQAGMIDVSPNVLKYWVTSITGGGGRFFGDVLTGGIGATQGVAPELANIPIARKFIRESDVSDARSSFWNEASRARLAAESYKAALKDGDAATAKKMLAEDAAYIRLAKMATRFSKMAGAKRNEIEKINASDLPLTEKKAKIREIEKREQEIYDRFLRTFDKAENK